jgi:DNA replication and repair protein RecF
VLKLSVLEMIKEKTKQPVVLLLDDVLSELDEEKQKQILSYQQDNQQTIINSALPQVLKNGTTIALKGANHE